MIISPRTTSIINSVADLRQTVRDWMTNHLCVALVPTMGNLHEGHLALVNAATSIQVDRILVSVFVNPMQFDRAEDLVRYPRTPQDDAEKVSGKVDVLFVPSEEEMFPRGHPGSTYVEVPKIGDTHEGRSRPGHFRGVTTIVSKLFNLVQPQVVCLGEKDFQQLVIIRQLIEDLNYKIHVLEVPTVRDAYGLACSSRNRHLSTEEQRIAPILHQTMIFLTRRIDSGLHDTAELCRIANDRLTAAGFRPEQLSIVDPSTLDPTSRLTKGREYRILFSAWIGRTKLIDNLKIRV